MSEEKQKSEDSLDEGLDDRSAVTPETNEFVVLSKHIIDFSRRLVDLRNIYFPFEQIYGHDVDDETMKTIMDTHTEKIHRTVLDTLAMLQVFIDRSLEDHRRHNDGVNGEYDDEVCSSGFSVKDGSLEEVYQFVVIKGVGGFSIFIAEEVVG